MPKEKVERVPLTTEELEAHLTEQLAFIEASAKSFDDGFEPEAKRLALALRVLLHETKRSHSLLGQLGRLDQPFWSLAYPHEPASILSHLGLLATVVAPGVVKVMAPLDDVPEKKTVPFQDWWQEIVFVDDKKRKLSRQDVVLIAANQDGGGHVDPALDEVYSELLKNNSLGLMATVDGVTKPLEGAVNAALRQISHEVLKTLKDGYSKMPTYPEGAGVSGGMCIVEGTPPTIAGRPNPAYLDSKNRIVGRNSPCTCGSGKRFKRCCGKK